MAKVLLVDDEPTILIVLEAILRSAGHDTVTCNDSTSVPELIKNSRFDLMVSDVRMTPIDGFQLLKAARALKPPLPTILVSAYELQANGLTPQDLGAAGYLRKPFNNRELLGCVERALLQNG